jgi:osmotically-inducible protein OsmY
MPDKDALVKRLQAAIEHGARIDLQSFRIAITLSGGTVTLAGWLADIGAKRQAVRAAAGVAGVSAVVDKLRVGTDQAPADGATRNAVGEWLLRDIDFQNCTVHVRVKGQRETLREAGVDSAGTIEISVSNGVVTLSGQVISLSHKRLAGVLAWWSRGCRDVVNELSVLPPEDDNDDEIVDALRLVLESDASVHPAQITIRCHERQVTLEGRVATEGERTRAEMDAWYLDGVGEIINHIEVA